MNKINVAVVTGGFSAERGIALNGARLVMTHLDTSLYQPYLIFIDEDRWYALINESEIPLDKNDFSIRFEGMHIRFDVAFIIIHGNPAEDGKLQGYFDLLKIPYTAPSVFTSALTMNKSACKQYLRSFGVKMADSVLLQVDKPRKEMLDLIKRLPLPLFVKPNNNGSSYGVTKVKDWSELETALDSAFSFDAEVIVEEFVAGRELSNGVLIKDGKLIALPVTEIKSQNEFFDYKAKYLGESQEITPAEISPEQSDACRALSEKIYRAVQAKGMCRMDYIMNGNEFYFLEVNTIPGLSGQSIVPQQAQAMGMDLFQLFGNAVKEALTPSLRF